MSKAQENRCEPCSLGMSCVQCPKRPPSRPQNSSAQLESHLPSEAALKLPSLMLSLLHFQGGSSRNMHSSAQSLRGGAWVRPTGSNSRPTTFRL